jgi:hypothetical protein
MTEITPSDHIVPCADIAPVRMTGERRTLKKVPDQGAFATFNNWAHHEARLMAERGSCVTGTCRGLVDVSDWRLVEETDDAFTCEFSAEFSCRCR